MDSLTDRKIAELRNGGEIRLDEDSLSIHRVSNGDIAASVNLPFPPEGYGGGSIYVSPSEKYILFLFYSGQSEEAFSLFANDDMISLVFASGYQYGEAASYCFSDREDYLVQALPCMCSEWWLPWVDGDVESDVNGNLYFQFGRINVLKIQQRNFEKHDVIIRPKADWRPDLKEYSPFLTPEFIAGNALRVSWPWGKDKLDFPILGDIVLEPSS